MTTIGSVPAPPTKSTQGITKTYGQILKIQFDKRPSFWLTASNSTVVATVHHSDPLKNLAEQSASYRACNWSYFVLGDFVYVSNQYHFLKIWIVSRPGERVMISKEEFDLRLNEVEGRPRPQSRTKCDPLSTVLANTDASDFSITCSDGVSVPVHSAILASFWPFFSKLVSNDCKEKTERNLVLDFPSSWVTPMVHFIYYQPVSLSFDQATGLLIVAEMYLLPELVMEARSQVKTMMDKKISIEECITGWERAVEADNGEMKRYFAARVAEREPNLHPELFAGWGENKMMQLYFDTVQ